MFFFLSSGGWMRKGLGKIILVDGKLMWNFTAPHLGYWIAAPLSSTGGKCLNTLNHGLRETLLFVVELQLFHTFIYFLVNVSIPPLLNICRFLWSYLPFWIDPAPFIFSDGSLWRNTCDHCMSSGWIIISLQVTKDFMPILINGNINISACVTIRKPNSCHV